MNAVRDCIDSRVRCVTILSNGFAEEGDEGRARQDKLVALAKEGGVRILGPNSLGIINLTDKVALSANEILSLPELTAGSCGLISRSEEHTSELQSLMSISYAVFCFTNKINSQNTIYTTP